MIRVSCKILNIRCGIAWNIFLHRQKFIIKLWWERCKTHVYIHITQLSSVFDVFVVFFSSNIIIIYFINWCYCLMCVCVYVPLPTTISWCCVIIIILCLCHQCQSPCHWCFTQMYNLADETVTTNNYIIFKNSNGIDEIRLIWLILSYCFGLVRFGTVIKLTHSK